MSALAGKLREVTGKSATRKIRTEESMPAVVYGLKDNVSMVVNPKELKKLIEVKGRNALIELKIEGASDRNVVLKEFQAHPLRSGRIKLIMRKGFCSKVIKKFCLAPTL